MWAAAENHVPIMHMLLEAGAAVDASSTGGFTALMFAVRQDARDALQLLLEAGAKVNVRMPDRAAQAAGRAPTTESLLSMAVTIGTTRRRRCCSRPAPTRTRATVGATASCTTWCGPARRSAAWRTSSSMPPGEICRSSTAWS